MAALLFLSTSAAAQVLSSGGSLGPGQSIESPSHRYRLTNTNNGTLELAEHGFVIWAEGPFGPGTLEMQSTDGNLVFYSGGTPLWDSGTAGSLGAYLAVQDDGNLVIYSSSGPQWSSDTAASSAPAWQLRAGGELSVETELTSQNGQYRLRNQSDGNLVLYQGVLPLWFTGTGNAGPAHMQYDGNFVLYRSGGAWPWHTQTYGNPGARLELTNYGNVVVKSAGGAVLWQSGPGDPEPTTPQITINGVSDRNGEVNVRVGQSLNVFVEGVPAGPGFTAELYAINQCCDGPARLQQAAITQRPQSLTFTAPGTVGWYDVVLVYCCPDPYPETTAALAVAVGPLIKAQPAGYLTLGNAGEGQVTSVRPNHPLTVQVHNASQGTDRVAWFRLQENGQLGSIFDSKSINGDLNAAVPFTAPDATTAGQGPFALRLTNAAGLVIGSGPTLTVPVSKVPFRRPPSTTDLYGDIQVGTGEVVRAVTAANALGLPQDRLELFRVGGEFIRSEQLDGAPNTTLAGVPAFARDFTIPGLGSYEVRLVAGDTNLRISTSSKLIVPTPPPALTIDGIGQGGTLYIRPNHPVNVQVSNAPDGSDRVVWVRVSDGLQVRAKSLEGNPNALVQFTVPEDVAAPLYEIRLLAGSSNTLRATGPRVSVPENRLPLKPDFSPVDLYVDFQASQMETVRVTVSDILATQADWLGLFRVGTPDTGAPEQIQTLSGPPSTQNNGYGIYYRIFTMPPSALTRVYEVRLFAGDTGIRTATSKRISVLGNGNTSETTLTINGHGMGGEPVPVSAGATLNVVVNGEPLYATDKVEIRLAGSSVSAVPGRYLNGQTTPPSVTPLGGSFSMTGPADNGLYNTVVMRTGGDPNAAPTIAAFGPAIVIGGEVDLGGVDTPYYYSTDAIGSVRVITTATGSLAARKDYLPFGNDVNSTTTSTAEGDRVGFVGKERDPETGLDYSGARYRQADTGRFTRPDPLGGRLLDPQTLNKYVYARNNPLRIVDPLGLYDVDAKCLEDKRCAKEAAQFEKERKDLSNSENAKVAAAADAYGTPGDGNGVTLSFENEKNVRKACGPGSAACVNSSYVGDPGSGAMKPVVNVLIQAGFSGTALRRTLVHEGSHVSDAMGFVKSWDVGKMSFDAAKNPTIYETEFRAYQLETMVDPTVAHQLRGQLPAQTDMLIDSHLRKSSLYGPQLGGWMFRPEYTSPR